LSDANLRDADLSDANLSDANLRAANLSDANLSDANLSDADLNGTIGNMREVFSMQIETYSIVFTNKVLQIGCKRFTHQEWKDFEDEEIIEMDSHALTFWKKYKDFIFMAIELRLGKGN
jgi:uncharacterized protein YjbI with pentapeptide repeats